MTRTDTHEIDLGLPEDHVNFPAAVQLNGSPYWLVRVNDKSFRLFSGICPHAGGEVRPHEDTFFCPLHWWMFSQADGTCTNVDDERLMERRVELREDGRLYAVGEDF